MIVNLQRTGLLLTVILLLALPPLANAVVTPPGDATLTIEFPGMRGIHTEVRVADGVPGEASGARVARANWQHDGVTITVPPGLYDLRMRQGAAVQVVDDVDCSTGECHVDGLSARLQVKFPGLSRVHTQVLTAEGERVTHANGKSDSTEIRVFPQVYTLSIRKGGATVEVAGVDCHSGSCVVDDLVAEMSVLFPGLSSVHTNVYPADAVAGEVTGKRMTRANRKTNATVIPVFRQVFDVSVRQGGQTIVVDGVDCSAGSCTVDGLVHEMTVEFAGLSGVHTSVHIPDGVEGTALGDRVARANWKTDKALIPVLAGHYDVKIAKGGASVVVDDVDCSGGDCRVDDLMRIMTVQFPGLSGIHTSVRVPDGEPGQAEGAEAIHANWKNDQAQIPVFPGFYDLRVRQGATTHIVDNVDCRDQDCQVSGLVRTLVVEFPGLAGVHTDVRVSDGAAGQAEGGKITKANGKTDQATIKLLPQQVDLRIRKGGATLIVDGLDCRADAPCVANDLVATLNVEFPGMTRVHTDVRVPDGVTDSAGGAVITKANWKDHAASIVLLRQVVDVRVRHGLTTVFDDLDCRSGACSAVIEGSLQASLIDGDANIPIPGHRIDAYEKASDGSLDWVQRRTSSPLGRANFSLPGTDSGRIYVLRVRNPLGNGKKYYSPLIDSDGELDFIVTANGDNTLDQTPPTVAFSAPTEGGNVSIDGFQVSGSAADNRQVDTLLLTVGAADDDSGDPIAVPVEYDPDSGTWSASIPGSALTAATPTVLSITVSDLAQNSSSASLSVVPVVDIQGPQIVFLSHQDQDSVQETGFLLSGTVSDLTGVAALRATLSDPSLGVTIDQRLVAVSADSGAWTLAVKSGQIAVTGATPITVTLDALDNNGNLGSAGLQLLVTPVDNSGLRLINRISFGATPALLDEVDTLTPLGFLDQQLNPADIDDSALEARIAGIEPETLQELQTWTLVQMVYSRRQLREVMTWFWDNHFNTDINTQRMNADEVELSNTVAYELAENRAFRANALGRFRDLLEISAKSPAMLIYLDSISNVQSDSNENYAREVMELHTLSVDGGYGDDDVAAAAELFTGWTVVDGAFFFDADRHNPDPQTVLGQVIPGGGMEQGEALLDLLAGHPSTAQFLCTKLVVLLVDDQAPASLVSRCADTFLATIDESDQIAMVLDEILSSPEFNAVYRNKIKTPLELVVGAVRNLDGDTDGDDLAAAMAPMGLRLYQNPVPTGWSERGDDWINASLLLERTKWLNALARRSPGSGRSALDPMSFFPARGFETAEGIVNDLLRLTISDDRGDFELQQALLLLEGTNGFDIGDADAEERLRRLEGAVLSYPQYQFQ